MEKNKKIVVGNMKMNLTAEEVSQYLKQINNKIGSKRVVICPSNLYVPYFVGHDYLVGLQNIYYHESGAYTGEVSPVQAASMGISLVILGHSERREYFKETDRLINSKIKDAIKANLKVVLCVGETKEERDMMRTDKVLKKELIGALKDLDADMLKNVIIAYEPIWAIGTGTVPSKKEIEKTIDYIKGIVYQEFLYENIPVLYGGSVNEKNIESLNQISNVSGFLVGKATIDATKFLHIIEVAVHE